MSIFRDINFKVYGQRCDDMSSLCPWTIMAVPGIVLLKGGALCGAFEFVAPDIGSASEAQVANVATMFNRAIMQLGKGWTVQFELQRRQSNEYPRSPSKNPAAELVEQARAYNFSGHGKHFENRYFLIFTYELPREAELKGASSFYKKQGESAVSAAEREQKRKAMEAKNRDIIKSCVDDFIAVTSKVTAVLGTVMAIHRLDDNGLFSLIHSSVSMDWGDRKLPEDYKIFLDSIVSDSDMQTSTPLKLGDFYIPIVTVKDFPNTTSPAMFDLINRAGCSLRWSTRFMCYSREDAEKKIEAAEKRFHSARKSLGQMVMESVMHVNSDRENSAAIAEEADASAARVALSSGAIGFGSYLSNIMVFSKSLQEAEDAAKYIMGIVTSAGFSAKEETHNALQAFLAMQPGNIYADSRELFISTTNLSHIVPASSVWAGMANNGFMGDICGSARPHVVCQTEFGIPFFLNLNVHDVGHTWISGPTGAGKSTLLELLEAQWLKYPGARVIIFDKDRSARGLTMCVGGNYLEPGKDATTFQPLAELDTPEDQRWAADFIEMLLLEQKVQVTPSMRKSIFSTIKLLSTKPVAERDLTSFQQYCSYENPETHNNDVEDGLSPYVIDGQYGNLFDSQSANVAIRDWTMIEMGSLMNMSECVVAPSLYYLFHECEKKFDGRPVLLVLDEAWVFLKNPVFAAKIVEWLKTLRKKHVFVVFATQEIDDAAKSPIGGTIVSQCPTKIYLADPGAGTPMIKEAYRKFGLEDSEIDLLANGMVKKRDYYYKSSLGSRKFQLDLDALQLGILTTSQEDHLLLDGLEQEYGRNCGRPLVNQILRAKGIDFSYLPDALDNTKYIRRRNHR